MLIRNDTPFAALGFGDLHRDGIGMAVVAVRGRYDLSAEGALSLADTRRSCSTTSMPAIPIARRSCRSGT